MAGFADKLAILIVKADLNKDRKMLLFPSGRCNQSHADNFWVIFIEEIIDFGTSFFLQPFYGQVGFETTDFGMGCNFTCFLIQGFWMWTGQNFVFDP